MSLFRDIYSCAESQRATSSADAPSPCVAPRRYSGYSGTDHSGSQYSDAYSGSERGSRRGSDAGSDKSGYSGYTTSDQTEVSPTTPPISQETSRAHRPFSSAGHVAR